MNTGSSKDLLIVNFESLADMLFALNNCPFLKSENLCEQIRYGGHSDLLCIGLKSELYAWVSGLASKSHFKIIENIHSKLISAFFHLEHKQLFESAIIVETVALMQLLVSLDHALKNELELAEINVPRFQQSLKSIVMTGSASNVEEVYNQLKNNIEIKIIKIENVSDKLRELY